MQILQGTLDFSNTSKKTVKKTIKKSPFIGTKKLKISTPKHLTANIYALEKIRKKQFSSEVFNIQLPELLSPDEMVSIYYILMHKNINRDFITDIILNSILKLKSISKENSLNNFYTSLKGNIYNSKKFFDFIDKYKEIYQTYVKYEILPSNEYNKFYNVFEMFPVSVIEKDKVNLFLNKVSSIVKAFNSKQINLFFTEENPLKSYCAVEGLNGKYISENFSTAVKYIKERSLDISILFLDSKKVKIQNEDVVHIKRNTVTRKLINNKTVDEALILKEAIFPKMKNFGLSFIFGPANLIDGKSIEFKKHEIIAIPLITVYFNENKFKNVFKKALGIDGRESEFLADYGFSVFCTVSINDFMKSPLDKENPVFYINKFEDIQMLRNLNEFEIVMDNLNYVNKARIENCKKDIAKNIAIQLKNEANLKENIVVKHAIENILKEIDKKVDIELIFEKLSEISKNENRIKRLIKISLLKKYKQTVLDYDKTSVKENIKYLAEKVYFKLKIDDVGLLLLLKIVTVLIKNFESSSIYELSPGGLLKSDNQDRFVKPFEFLLFKDDFINLALEVGKVKDEQVINLLESSLKEINFIRKNKENRMHKLAENFLYIINYSTRREFKNLNDAFRYVFSYNPFIDKKYLLFLKENYKDFYCKTLIKILELIIDGYGKKVIKQNQMSKIYSQIPSIIQKIKDLYYYIEQKEFSPNKKSLYKTLEKLEMLEREISEINGD